MMAEALKVAQRRLADKRAHAERGYKPSGAAQALREYHGKEVLLCGPAGTGKTRGVLEWIHELCIRHAGIRVLIVRKVRASLAESVLYTYEDFVLGPGHYLLNGPKRADRDFYEYSNGSRIILGGLDKPTKLFSTEYDIIYVAEAIEATLNDWESLLRALRHFVLPWQQLIGDTNPSYPQHWLKQRCEEKVCKLIPSSHEDNPILFDHEKGEWTPAGLEYLVNTLEKLTGARLQRLRYGLWAQAEGAVYEGFDDTVHVIDRDKLPKFIRRWRVIDFGYTNAFVCQWWGMDYDGRLYLYREIYMSQRTVAVHAKAILKLSAGEVIEATVSDHDAEDNATLNAAGIVTTLAQKEISPGIQGVQERIKLAGDGKPRLYVVRDALVERDPVLAEKKKPLSTLDEFPAYVWALGKDGKPNKEEPIDDANHGMDAMRYIVRHIDVPTTFIPTGALVATARRNMQPQDPAKPTANDLHAMVSPVVRKRGK